MVTGEDPDKTKAPAVTNPMIKLGAEGNAALPSTFELNPEFEKIIILGRSYSEQKDFNNRNQGFVGKVAETLPVVGKIYDRNFPSFLTDAEKYLVELKKKDSQTAKELAEYDIARVTQRGDLGVPTIGVSMSLTHPGVQSRIEIYKKHGLIDEESVDQYNQYRQEIEQLFSKPGIYFRELKDKLIFSGNPGFSPESLHENRSKLEAVVVKFLFEKASLVRPYTGDVALANEQDMALSNDIASDLVELTVRGVLSPFSFYNDGTLKDFVDLIQSRVERFVRSKVLLAGRMETESSSGNISQEEIESVAKSICSEVLKIRKKSDSIIDVDILEIIDKLGRRPSPDGGITTDQSAIEEAYFAEGKNIGIRSLSGGYGAYLFNLRGVVEELLQEKDEEELDSTNDLGQGGDLTDAEDEEFDFQPFALPALEQQQTHHIFDNSVSIKEAAQLPQELKDSVNVAEKNDMTTKLKNGLKLIFSEHARDLYFLKYDSPPPLQEVDDQIIDILNDQTLGVNIGERLADFFESLILSGITFRWDLKVDAKFVGSYRSYLGQLFNRISSLIVYRKLPQDIGDDLAQEVIDPYTWRQFVRSFTKDGVHLLFKSQKDERVDAQRKLREETFAYSNHVYYELDSALNFVHAADELTTNSIMAALF